MKLIFLAFFMALFMSACKNGPFSIENPGQDESELQIDDAGETKTDFYSLIIADNFRYETRQVCEVSILLHDHLGNILPDARLEIFSELKTITGGPTNDTIIQIPARSLAKGYTNQEGYYFETLTLPAHVKHVFIVTSVFGVSNTVKGDIINHRIELNI